MRKQPAFRTETCSEGCLQHLLQLIIHELHLGADDDLAGGLVGADDTGSTGSLHSLLIHSGVVLNGEAQAGSAVVHAGDVLLAADGLQHASSNLSVVVVGQNDLLLSLFGILVLTAGGLQVELGDGEVEHEVEHHECSDAQRNDHPGLSSCRQRSGEHQVGSTCGEAEASTETGVVGDDGEDAVQSGVHNVQREAQEQQEVNLPELLLQAAMQRLVTRQVSGDGLVLQ